MRPADVIADLRVQGIAASMPVDVRDASLTTIAEWVERHRYDDDPPKVAVAYVEYLLGLIRGDAS